MPDWLDPNVVLLSRLLKTARYTNGHFGKWHLSGGGIENAPLPAAYGIDEAAVWTGPGKGVFEGTSVANKAGNAHDRVGASYLTEAAVEHTIRFLRSAKGNPFYLNLWIHETHHLVSGTEADKRAYPNTAEPERTYYAAVTRADLQTNMKVPKAWVLFKPLVEKGLQKVGTTRRLLNFFWPASGTGEPD